MRLFTTLLCCVPLLAQAADLAQLRGEAEALIPPFQQQLLASVQTAVATGGPAQAVEACRQLAPGIAQQHSVAPWKVGRTALRLRNPDNRPDAWEQAVLEDFQRRSQAGEAVALGDVHLATGRAEVFTQEPGIAAVQLEQAQAVTVAQTLARQPGGAGVVLERTVRVEHADEIEVIGCRDRKSTRLNSSHT